MSPYICLIIISILFFPLYSIGQIYKWVDEEGIVHFTDDPSEIPEKYASKSEKPKQDLTISPLVEVEEPKNDLKQPINQKSNGMTLTQLGLKVYEEKSIR